MNGAKKPIGSNIDAVRLMTFRRVSANSFGLILNKKASFWTSQITPSALSVGKVPSSPMVRTDCARSSAGIALSKCLSFDIHLVSLNPPSESKFTNPA